MQTIAQTACDLLLKGESFVLATIISQSGSTPRTAGTKMVVTSDGSITGTIGGGLLEAAAIERAKALIAEGRSALMPVDLSYETVASMDMICGGQAEVLLDCIVPSDVHRKLFTGWHTRLQKGRGALLTHIAGAGQNVSGVRHALVDGQGQMEGPIWLDKNAQNWVAAAVKTPGIQTLRVEDGLLVLESAGRISMVHIFGAGHVAQPTARLANLVGFRVTVADDRETFANRERFPEASDIRVLESFEACITGQTFGAEDYVVILTRGHLHDKTVLAQALATGAGYIGMIGSRKKRNTIYQTLLREGVEQTDLDRVHSPIGLAIGAETPQEIALSIVAEMIAVRAGVQP